MELCFVLFKQLVVIEVDWLPFMSSDHMSQTVSIDFVSNFDDKVGGSKTLEGRRELWQVRDRSPAVGNLTRMLAIGIA